MKAVIFDMDGVLIDSEPLHIEADLLTLESFGVKLNQEDLMPFIGSTNPFMFKTLIERFGLSVTVDEMINVQSKIKSEIIAEKGYPIISGIPKLIKDLHEHGVLLSVASSSPLYMIEEVTKLLGVQQYFNALVSGETVSNPKPAPDVFLKAAKELGVKPCECIVIEDSFNGVSASVLAGIKCIGFINPNSGNQDLSKANVLITGFDYVDYEFIYNEYLRANGLPITIVNTNNLILREFCMDDFESLYKMCNQSDLKKYVSDISDSIEIERSKLVSYIENAYPFYGYGYWGVFLKESNKLIGRCGIMQKIIEDTPEIELGYLIDKNYQGLGYAYEACMAVIDYAFNKLNLNKIVAVINKENIPSINLAKKLGMTLLKDILYHEQYCYLYILNNELVEKDLSTW